MERAETTGSSARWRHAPDVVARRIRGELILVPIRRTSAELDGFFTLNATGADIWTWIGEGRSLNEMAKRLAEEYEIDAEVARADVNGVVNELMAAGALVASGD
ncbi:MAG: PqqD family protein [Kiritimatiellae bacterium]|nr:PqqD family protein [Kiritimatiellia bacterium]